MHKRELPIKSLCHESWEMMRGDFEVRHCASCDHEVHDLSAMTRREAQSLLARRSVGQRLCVRYAADENGQVEFAPQPLIPPALLLRGRQLALGAGLTAAVLGGCMPAGTAVGSSAAHQAAESLGEHGACAVSLEPVLPLTVSLHATACTTHPVRTELLEVPSPPPPPLPEPPSPAPSPVPPTPPPLQVPAVATSKSHAGKRSAPRAQTSKPPKLTPSRGPEFYQGFLD